MITLRQLSKNFDQRQVVKNIDLTIEPGEIVGLLGPNGAGKTTTIRMIAGVLPPTKGEIFIDDQAFEGNELTLKRRIGYLPENNPLYDEMTVEEHLHFFARIKGLKDTELKEAIEFAVKSTNIEDVYYRLIGELSKGYRQRVGLAQAILCKPEVLLLDEPTEGLDPNQRREIQQLLADLKKDRTVIVSSHVLGEISKLANRIVIIHEGKVVSDDTPENLVRTKEGAQIVKVEVTGKGISAALKALKGVDKVTKDKDNTYMVYANSKDNIRKTIFEAAVAHKWTLLTLQPIERQLEDVFSELTEGVV